MLDPIILKCYIPADFNYVNDDSFGDQCQAYVPSRVILPEVRWSEFVQRDIKTPQGIKRVVFKVVPTQYGRVIDYTVGYCIKLERIKELVDSEYNRIVLEQVTKNVDPV